MKKVTVKILTVNAAFVEAPEREVARILRETAKRIEAGQEDGCLLDINGNSCGIFKVMGGK